MAECTEAERKLLDALRDAKPDPGRLGCMIDVAELQARIALETMPPELRALFVTVERDRQRDTAAYARAVRAFNAFSGSPLAYQTGAFRSFLDSVEEQVAKEVAKESEVGG